MKPLIALTLALGLGVAQNPAPSCVYYADDLERAPQTLELGSNFLTELVAWLPIEDVKSARRDLLRWSLDPVNKHLLNLASRPSAKGITDLFLKVEGRTLRFRLLLGTRTAPGRCLILKERTKAGQPTVIVRDPSPIDAPTPQAAGPIPAPPMETAAVPPSPGQTGQNRRGAYFGLSLGYPPLPVQGSLSLGNLWYGAMVGLEGVLWGLDVQLGGGYLPSAGSGLLEGYLVWPFSRDQAFNFYLGLGGGVVLDKPNYPFVGGLVGVDFGLVEGVSGWLEATPRYLLLLGSNELVVGGRLGFKWLP